MFIIRNRSIIKSFFRYQHIYIDHYDISSTGISLKEFHQRRVSLVNLIRSYLNEQGNQSSKNFTVCLPSSTRLFMGPDVPYYPFKQQADFYYLTGCMQADAVFLLNVENEKTSTNLFLQRCKMNSIEEYERWFGQTITDKDKICQLFGIDNVYPIDQLSTINVSSSSILIYNGENLNDSSINRQHLISFLKRFSSSSTVINRLNLFLQSLRSIKSSAEQNLIRQACQLTSKAFIQTIKSCSKNISNEYMVKARFQYECQLLDDTPLAFNPVVAANGRSNIIHYQKNNQPIDKDDLIMLDGGCLFKQYSGDVTRLWPINGRFSSPHRQLYEILLAVQKDLIRYFYSGDKYISRAKLNTLSDEYMIKYLREEHILSNKIDDYQAKKIINSLSPTSVSHHLGLDLHDCEDIPFSEPLQTGSVITIEPGLYIPWDCQDVPSIYRGFASRLEDDILITEHGCEVLTSMCPKEIEDLYKLLDQRDQ